MDTQTVLLALIVLLLAGGVIVLWLRLRQATNALKTRDLELFSVRRDLSNAKDNLNNLSGRINSTLGAVFDAVLVMTPGLHLVALNPAARDLFAVDMTAIGKSLMSITHDHELDSLAQDALTNPESLDSQITIGERTFRVRRALISGVEGPALVLTLQDISELLRLTRARRDMVANFSHDLRTPISSIRLLVDTLTNNFGKNYERDLRLLGKIAGETDSLEHMTQELIDLSVIESGKAIVRMVPVQLSDILQEAADIMGTQIEQKKLEFVNLIPPDLIVLADPEQTRRVVTNLIHNSVKFTPPGGKITFEATTAAQLATIHVRDTGIGIPPQERTRIFERFYQVDTARTGKTGGQSGSGLGLSIAKHIIEAQGGRIWAEAPPPDGPGGACIGFTIPLADGRQANSQ